MSPDTAADVTAWATAVLAAGAIATAIFAYLAFRKQSQEVHVLVAESQQHADDRRRAQAEHLFMWLDRPDPTSRRTERFARPPETADEDWVIRVHVRNAASRPVNGVMCDWRKHRAFWGTPSVLPRLMPGEEHTFSRPLPDDLPGNFDLRVFDAAVMFRDAAKVLWRIRNDGSLSEVAPDEPAEAF